MVDVHPATWMADLFPFICKRKLSELFLPGSHDSAITFACLSETDPVEGLGSPSPTAWGPDADASLIDMPLGDLVKGIVRNWAVTQHLSLEAQLVAGIRYFDFRIAKVDNQFKFTHALLSRLDLFSMLEPVKEFMLAHPGEVLIIHCQHFFNMQDGYENLLRLFQSLFGDMLAPDSMIQKECFDVYIKNDRRVVLVWGGGAAGSLRDSSLVCDQGAFLDSPWDPNRMKAKEDLAAFLLATQRARLTSDTRLSVVQCILDTDDFRSQPWQYLLHSSLLHYERDLNVYICDEVLSKLGKSRGFIYMMDDVMNPNGQVIKKVIGLNTETN